MLKNSIFQKSGQISRISDVSPTIGERPSFCLPPTCLVRLPSAFNPKGPRIQNRHRRSFFQLALAALPLPLLAQTPNTVPTTKTFRVPAGTDREEKKRSIGLSSTTYKVLTQDTGGALFVLEQANQKKGGPPRHLHHNEDELFYSLEGDYVVEVGSERFHLKTGDCVLGPREIPHAWAFVGGSQGRLLISFAPAGKMEAFFDERENMELSTGLRDRCSAATRLRHGANGAASSCGVMKSG